MTDWSREPWIKVYGRESGGWQTMSWEARGLYRLLQTEANRDGVVEHGGKGPRWVAIVFRMPEPVAERALSELMAEGWLNPDGDRAWTLPVHIEQQTSVSSSSERVRRYRERQRNADPLHVTPDVSRVTNRKEQIRRDNKRGEGARVPADPKAAQLAKDLQACPAFECLDVASVAEALIGHLGIAAMNIDHGRWRPAIAEAAVLVEDGATEARRRQVLSWKFADLRDGKRNVKRPQGSDRVATDMARIRAATTPPKADQGEPVL